jgi:hypothetical protein
MGKFKRKQRYHKSCFRLNIPITETTVPQEWRINNSKSLSRFDLPKMTLAILNYFFLQKTCDSSSSSANILLLVMRLMILKRENYSVARKKANTNPRPLGHLGLPQMRWWNWTIFCLNNQKKKKKQEV